MTGESLRCDVCAVRDRGACSALDEAERRDLARLGRHRTLKRGQTLFRAGDENALSATLISGALKVSAFDQDGTEHIVSLIHPAGFVGELFAPSAHHDVVAVTDCELCVFPRAQYEKAIQRYPKLGRAMLSRSAEALTESRELLAAVSGRTATQRVAGFLASLAHAANDTACHSATEFDLVLTRSEIAALLGLTIETVSRQLTTLENDGVIRRKGARRILIEDASRLRKLAA